MDTTTTKDPSHQEEHPTATLLKNQSLQICHSINTRDISHPLALYASPDYIYENTEDNGQVLRLSGPEMLRLREWYFSELSPSVYAEVINANVHIDWHAGYATVWVGLLVHNDARGVEREKVNVFFWRWEDGRWVWWKEHTSAGFANVDGVGMGFGR